MKTRSSKATRTIVRLFSAFTLVVLLSLANSTYAQTMVSAQAPATAQAALKYLGAHEDGMLFHLQFRNEAGAKFRVSIHDAQGEELFNGVFSDKNFDKKFQLPKVTKDKIAFTITELNGKQLHLFEVNTRFVEEVLVRRL
ncbi:MAG TPA: hypothetical protein VD996_10585 [Chitinophagaceae bacterium]|nr:hypothetical protein [Chitinophagaceae bacterium]